MTCPQRPLRSPADVMSAARARAVVPNALSFPRATMREIVRDRYRIEKPRFALDHNGCGEILYRVQGGGRTFHFFLLSNKLPEEQKTDRNFAAGWDAMGVLCEGEWSAEREAHLRREVPKQRAGFADYDTLVYARGNRSTRVFDQVVASLAAGRQPDLVLIAPIGYILRTTAFIGNGQLGTKPLAGFAPDHPLRRPYHAQFCSAFALREFVFDLVDHMARARSPDAVRLAPAYRRYIGIGNSAATGLSAFVANHPHFMHQWSHAWEEAHALVNDRLRSDDAAAARFERLLAKAIRYYHEGAREDDGVFVTPQALAFDLEQVRDAGMPLARREQSDMRWSALCAWARRHVCLEACEILDALALELYPDLAERFSGAFEADERFAIEPGASVAALRQEVQDGYGWALQPPRDGDAHYFWYRSSSAPRDVRRGLRGRAPRLEVETTMDTPAKVRTLWAFIANAPDAATVADVVHARPDLRHVVARVQSLAGRGYGELRDPWLARDFTPFGSVRFALAFFGMEKCEAAFPKSVRGTFMQGAPTAEDVAAGRDGDWPFPLMPGPAMAADATTLAPLPESVRYVPPVVLANDDRPVRRIAPNELARMIYTALQGHGATLGVAEDAAGLVVLAQARGDAGVAAAVRHCAGGLVSRAPPQDAGVARHTGACVTIAGHGYSVLLAAPDAFDLACARACAGSAAATIVRDVRDPWLAEGLVLRAARYGCLGLVVCHDQRTPQGWSLSCAGPDAGGTWLARGVSDSVAALDGRLAAAARSGLAADDGSLRALAEASAMARASVTSLAANDFLIVVTRSAEAATRAPLDLLAAGGALHTAWRGDEVARREKGWYRDGIAVARGELDALAEAGRALLLPQAEEARVLPPGADPLKAF